MDLKEKTVLVYGAKKSGIGACNLLTQVGARPVLYDQDPALNEEAVRAELKDPDQVRIQKGDLPQDLIRSLDLSVLSPGVPCDIPQVLALYEAGIPVWSEVELAWQCGQGTVLAITGTNGKTTTTSLVGKIMKDYHPNTMVVGNIGIAYTSLALASDPDTVTVAEISSFQLETIDTFHPKVSAILNITEDHLNRHHTMEEYIRVKELITKNQRGNDVVVLNYEDEVLRRFGQEQAPCRVFWFSSQRELSEGAYLDGEWITLRVDGKTYQVVKTSELNILGTHNHENVMAAVAMAYFAGVPVDSIRHSCMTFTAVPHRIEFVEEIGGVAYYNDSKGTNPDAAIKGIQAMIRPTYLIGGGYDKNSSYDEWIQSFDGKVKLLVLIGQTKEKIAEAAKRNGFTDICLCENLKEAVEKCASLAKPGDAVLLSPACASWGQFDNYEQRGDIFKSLVRDMLPKTVP